MYDFPRSHVNHAEDMTRNQVIRRHCYNNAAPVSLEGNVFRYDVSPKPGSSTGQVVSRVFFKNMEIVLKTCSI